MSATPPCPECQSEYAYPSGPLFVCPDCAHEWTSQEAAVAAEALLLKDAHGTILQNGDTVKLTKDLKVKGTSTTLKIGTKVRNIRLSPGSDHDLDCRVAGIGPMKLKSRFVKKVPTS